MVARADREQRLVFGEVAERYHLVRPAYPAAVVGRIADLAGPGGVVVEVGAGTGKLTVALLAHDLAVTALEPSSEMASVLRRTCPDASVVEVAFEEWAGPPAEAAVVAAGQSWHWVRAEVRLDLAHRALRPGGAVALAWNREQHAGPVGAAIDAAYRRHAPVGRPVTAPVADGGGIEQGAADELTADDRFDDVRVEEHHWPLTRPRDEYLDLMTTHSPHRMLDPAVHDRLLTAIGDAIDGHGGTIHLDVRTTLVTVRRR
ncbi:class I SAM-dependent methyltransferase [soil metagenome]